LTPEQESILVALVSEALMKGAKPEANENLIKFLLSNLRSWIENEFRKRGVPSQDMNDVLQELWRKVLEKLSDWREPAAFMLFLRYKIQDVAKEYRKGPKFEELVEEVCPSAHPTIEFGIAVAKALSQVPSRYADALVLVVVMGYSYEAAAEALGWKVSTLKKRLELARGKMRVLLADLI